MRKGSGADAPGLIRLPSGSLTIDANGRVAVSTLPRTFPESLVKQISETVLATFRTAREAHQPVGALVAEYATLKLTAREMRGGAIIFLAPKSLSQK